MDFLVINPPVSTPSEPASGAFVLASALTGHGFHAAFLDLSMAFYRHALSDSTPSFGLAGALRYLEQTDGFVPDRHRSASGAVHNALRRFSSGHNGWRLTAMDVTPPSNAHDPAGIACALEAIGDPFLGVYSQTLAPLLEHHRPRTVVISLAYLSQLAGGISLAAWLKDRGVRTVVGGSLLRSLAATGTGIENLRPHLGEIDLSNGASLIHMTPPDDFLNHLRYPDSPLDTPWLSPRPILPVTLSTGCWWRRCLFCPDRGMAFHRVPMSAIEGFIQSVPAAVMARRPIVHLLDSAVPPQQLRAFLPLARQHKLQFYGFARPEKRLLEHRLLEDAADAGCLMLQLGVESGSRELLDRFHKGINPAESSQVLQTAAACGIRTYVYLLFGLPGETDRDRASTLALLEDNSRAVDFVNLSIFNLPRFCELADRADEFDIAIDNYPGDDQMLYLYRPFTVNGASPRQEARRFISTLQRHPALRQACLQTPRWFRAAHLAMFRLENRKDA